MTASELIGALDVHDRHVWDDRRHEHQFLTVDRRVDDAKARIRLHEIGAEKRFRGGVAMRSLRSRAYTLNEQSLLKTADVSLSRRA